MNFVQGQSKEAVEQVCVLWKSVKCQTYFYFRE